MAHQIQVPLLAAELSRVLRIYGTIPLELEHFVIPTIQVAQLDKTSLGIQRAAVASANENAVAAQRACFRFSSVAGTPCRVDAIWVKPGATDRVNLAFDSVLTGAVNVSSQIQFTDTRILESGLQQPAGVLASGTQAAAGTERYRYVADGTLGTWIYPEHWVVSEFDFLEIYLETLNQGCQLSLRWTEFPEV